jgi:signal transduction histidine kinase
MARKADEWLHLLRELRAEFMLREDELELLHAIDMRLLEEDAYLDETLSYITDGTKALLRSEHVSILLKRGTTLECAYSSDGLDIGKRIAVHGSIAGRALTKMKPVFISDLSVSPLRRGYVPIAGYEGSPVRSLIEVPIVLRGTAIGVFCVESAKVAAFRPVHTRVMQSVAAQAAVALQKVQHVTSSALFSDLDQIILTTQVDSQQVIQRVLQRVMDELYQLHHVELSGAQILFRQGDNDLEIVYSTSPDDVGLVVPVDGSISGRAVEERRTVTEGDVSSNPRYVRMLGIAIKSEIAVPITLADDADDSVIIGVLNVESEEAEAFSGFNEIVLESFATKVRSLLAIAKVRTDLTSAVESRHANDLLIAIGDQTSHFLHRLNNSAGSLRVKILELLELVEERTLEPEFLRESLEELRVLADRTLEMPKEVSRGLGQEGNVVNVNKCIGDVLKGLRCPANVVVTTRLQANLPQLSLYSFDIVVQNLIKNAIDAMPDGGQLAVITKLVTHEELPAGYVQFAVRDTGVGIAEDILPHIFDLNFTTKKSKGKGLGLGLWWVRNFVLRSNGEISVDSKPDSGTEFCVKIPVATPIADHPIGIRSEL